MNELFTPSHLNQLRSGYSGINRVDPCLPAYRKLVALLDRATVPQLKQLAAAEIKFVSSLARNRLPIEEIPQS